MERYVILHNYHHSTYFLSLANIRYIRQDYKYRQANQILLFYTWL